MPSADAINMAGNVIAAGWMAVAFVAPPAVTVGVYAVGTTLRAVASVMKWNAYRRQQKGRS